MSLTPLTKALETLQFFADGPGGMMSHPDNVTTVVFVKRYETRDQWGIHLVNHHPGVGFDHRVVGLFGPGGRDDIDHELTHRWPDGEVVGNFNGLVKTNPDMATFIRRSVIPLEWKSFSDDELAERLLFRKGI